MLTERVHHIELSVKIVKRMLCCSCSKQVFLNSIILKCNWICGVHNTSDFQTKTEESKQTNTSILKTDLHLLWLLWHSSAWWKNDCWNVWAKKKKNMCHSYYLSSNHLNICHVTCQLGNTVTHLCWPAIGNSGIIYYYTQKKITTHKKKNL